MEMSLCVPNASSRLRLLSKWQLLLLQSPPNRTRSCDGNVDNVTPNSFLTVRILAQSLNLFYICLQRMIEYDRASAARRDRPVSSFFSDEGVLAKISSHI